ncbi:MAG: hypothetical protein CME88_04465 [Hirschia sp.]|nr:hypothetical protein [Hirschia sp.]MBF17614.1 hypothetical protein [Hirschia sp.]|tara:strand:+ start:379 stop:555 length:177 start_codon:yes stop_codon:yes gene_type:complete
MFEDEPVKKATRLLEDMSLEELAERIEMLEAETEACKQMIAKKVAQKHAADAIFGSGS